MTKQVYFTSSRVINKQSNNGILLPNSIGPRLAFISCKRDLCDYFAPQSVKRALG
jgi:hypothetical protein